MVAPTAYPVTIKVNDVDVSAFVPFDSISFDDYALQVSTWRMVIENPTGVTPARNHSVLVTTSTEVVFVGIITELKTTKRDNGITVDYECVCSDRKIFLQRSVIDVASLSGADTSILSGLLTNGYPDLSDVFDFSTDVNGFASGLDLPTGNANLLDALEGLSDLAGGGYPTLETQSIVSNGDLITFDAVVDSIPVIPDDGTAIPAAPYLFVQSVNIGATNLVATIEATGGNPADMAQALTTTGTRAAGELQLEAQADYIASGSKTLNNVTVDYYVGDPAFSASTWEILVIIEHDGGTASDQIDVSSADTWLSLDASTDLAGLTFPYTMSAGDSVYIDIVNKSGASAVNYSVNNGDFRFDNVLIEFSTPLNSGDVSAGDDNLQWNQDPLDNDFNFNIDTGDEFGFDFDFTEGDFDDFNSITVIGGNEEVAVVWTYESDGDLDHFNLETAITATSSNVPTVEVNTGSDASPTWTSQTVGLWGTDTLTGDGGDKDVLYDNTTHWLYFDSNPSALSKSIRVSGNILRPIRVRVESVDDGERTFATTIQNENITSEAQALAIASSKLNQRSAVKELTFTTYEPGIKVGRTIGVTDSNRGLNESLIVQSVRTRWLSPALAQFDITCGTDREVGADTLIANNDRRSRDNTLQAGTTVTEFSLLIDANDSVVFDANGQAVYEA